MGYKLELNAEQSVYLENLGTQTRVTTISSSPGQQQQSSSSFQTGSWTAPPEAFRTAIGVVVRLSTAQGERFLHVEGNRLSTLHDVPSLREAQPVPVESVAQVPVTPMQPISPVPPMTMGDMQMDRGGMSMQMGNMRLSMNPIARSQDAQSQDVQSQNTPLPTNLTDGSEAPSGQRNFCSQCGVALKLSDRFCANCGHRLD
jgi:zinc-ribbon domain